MTTTKRIQYRQYGGPEVLRLEDVEDKLLPEVCLTSALAGNRP